MVTKSFYFWVRNYIAICQNFWINHSASGNIVDPYTIDNKIASILLKIFPAYSYKYSSVERI